MHTTSWVPPLAAALLLASCNGWVGDPPRPGGPDDAVPAPGFDAGSPTADAGEPSDAGQPPDAGSPTADAGQPSDAGSPTADAGQPPDAGAQGKLIHVHGSTGSDSPPNTGGQADPFKTIQHAVDVMVPGDTVLVHAGSYAPFSVRKSGTPQKPLTIKAAGDGPPTLVATHRTAILVGDANVPPQLTVTDIVISGFHTSGGGTFWGQIGILGGRRVTVRDNVVTGTLATLSGDDMGITAYDAQEFIIENNTISEVLMFGIYVDGCNSPAASPAIIRGNTVSHCGHGVWAQSQDDGSDIDLWKSSNIVVEANTTTTSAGNGILAEHCSGIVYRNNLVYDNAWAGIWANSSDSVIEGNVAIGNNSCIWLNDPTLGNYEIRRNLCVRNNKPSPHGNMGPTLSVFASGPNVRVYHNVLYANGEASNLARGGIGVGQWGNVGNVTVRNNILVDDLGPELRSTAQGISAGLVVDHNLVRSSSSTLISWGGTSYATLSAWQSATGQGAGSLGASPLWVSPDAPNRADLDFHLSATSPAINAGVDVGLPYQGAAPDLGAYEMEP